MPHSGLRRSRFLGDARKWCWGPIAPLTSDAGDGVKLESKRANPRYLTLDLGLFSAAASRISAFNAFSSTLSPS
jgi:hypothetical protein